MNWVFDAFDTDPMVDICIMFPQKKNVMVEIIYGMVHLN